MSRNAIHLAAMPAIAINSSVARGGGWAVAFGVVIYSSIGLKSIQNSTFLVLVRPIFAPKMKTAPPQRDWGAEVVKNLLLFGPEKWSFCFWSLPKVGLEKGLIIGEDLFLEITQFRPEKPFEFWCRSFFFFEIT